MKICAIICEYNPMHLGHVYQIQKARELSGADYIICIMSGNFSQRGLPCVMDKYERSKIAIEAGADIVVAMPTADTLSCAEVFALSGVKIASAFENVTSLCFGAETIKLDQLKTIAQFLSSNNKQFLNLVRDFQKQGHSSPSSITFALKIMSERDIIGVSQTDIQEILSKPNNILAIEYLKAIYSLGINIEPIIIPREDNYHSHEVKTKFASATAIRELINKRLSKTKKYIPTACYQSLSCYKKQYGLVDYSKYYAISMYCLKKATVDKLRSISDIPEGLENRIHEKALCTCDYQQYLSQCNSKLYTNARLNRITSNLLLDIDKTDHITMDTTHPYIKVLAFKNDSKLLSSLKSNIPVILRAKDAKPFASSRLNQIETTSNACYSSLLSHPLNIDQDIFTIPYIKK